MGIIFDFDGVIALSEPVHAAAWEDVGREFERELPEGFIEGGIGSSDGKLANDLAQVWANGLTGGRVLESKRTHYQRRAPSETQLVPGIVELLGAISETRSLAVATSSSIKDIEPVLERFGIGKFFSAILTIESIENPKPHPEIYLKAAARLGKHPTDCWVFEDSIQGTRAARAAGARIIGMTTTLHADALQPVHAHFPDYKKIEEILSHLNGA